MSLTLQQSERSELGRALCTDRCIRKISFTGSYEIGDAICRMAGVKRVTMELGSNSPVIVLDDDFIAYINEHFPQCLVAPNGWPAVSSLTSAENNEMGTNGCPS